MSQSFGRYELVHPLAKGGMSEVYLSRLTGAAGFEKFCIIKTILPQMSADAQFVQRFQHEARVLVQLNHANIAQIYDMGQEAQGFYMAIEYVAGVDLGRLLEKTQSLHQAIPVPIALFIAQKALEALGYAHRKVGADGSPLGIVHRDVSPQNVMISYEGDVKVIDFGLAKSAVSKKGTLPAMVMGKLGYMAPEQARGEPVDYRSDIYACGVALWEMLAGRSLFQGQTVGELVAQMSNPSIPSLRTFRPELSEALDVIVRRALATKAEDRYARADDMARALNELIVREGHSPGAEEVGTYIRGVCPDEYDSQRKLISTLSVRDSSAPSPATSGAPPLQPIALKIRSTAPSDSKALTRLSHPTHEPDEPLETQAPQEAPAREALAVPGPRDQPPSSRKLKPLVIGLMAAVALVAAGGLVLVSMSPAGESPAPASQPPAALKVEALPSATPLPEETATPQGRVPSVVAYPVFLDRGEFYAHAGTAQGFIRGTAVQVLGPEEADTKRSFWGEGIVMEVSDSLVRFQVEPSVRAAPSPLFAAPLKTTPAAEDAPPEPVKRKRTTSSPRPNVE